MSGNKWILEVYLARTASGDHPVILLEFENLPQLRIALTNIPNHKYVVEMPAGATAADRVKLLDWRAQGFDIAIRTVSLIERDRAPAGRLVALLHAPVSKGMA